MVKLVGGVILFILAIGILFGIIPLNMWTIGAIVLSLIALWFG